MHNYLLAIPGGYKEELVYTQLGNNVMYVLLRR